MRNAKCEPRPANPNPSANQGTWLSYRLILSSPSSSCPSCPSCPREIDRSTYSVVSCRIHIGLRMEEGRAFRVEDERSKTQPERERESLRVGQSESAACWRWIDAERSRRRAISQVMAAASGNAIAHLSSLRDSRVLSLRYVKLIFPPILPGASWRQ